MVRSYTFGATKGTKCSAAIRPSIEEHKQARKNEDDDHRPLGPVCKGRATPRYKPLIA